MVARASQCDHDKLKLLLADQLDEHDQFTVQDHIESCDSCRRQLDSLAAGPDWWQDTSRLLRIDQLDLDASQVPPTQSDNADGPVAHEDDSTCDFVVNYLSPSDNPAMLGRLGEYEILEVVGRGGMGVVLKGYERELNRFVAIKVLAPHLASSAAARKRFAREAQAAAAVVHQHVVAIHAVDATSRLPYLVMQFVAGDSLQQRINADGALDLRDILRIGMQAAQGLAAAHAQGLVHRDVKPANILLERSVDRIVLSDFGLARAVDDASMTHSSVIAGTPQFMSPEQARGECVDGRSDLFSLGSVLYTMCAGRPPFRAETTLGVLRRITDSQPRPIREISPEIPDWLCEIVERLLAKQPSQRLGSADDVQSLLGRWLAHVQQPNVVPAPPRLRRRSAKSTRKRIGKLAAYGAAVCVAVAAGWLAWIQWGPAAPDHQPGSVARDARRGGIRETIDGSRAERDPSVASIVDESQWRAEVDQLKQDVLSIEARWSADATTDDPWDTTMSLIRSQMDRLEVEERENNDGHSSNGEDAVR